MIASNTTETVDDAAEPVRQIAAEHAHAAAQRTAKVV